jgi:type IV secretory pathway VirB3-like protein
MKTNATYYSLSVWLTSVILTPIIVTLYLARKENMPPDKEIGPMMLMWGGIFSIPSLLILGLTCHYLVNRFHTVKAVKMVLTVISVILTYAPFWVINRFSFKDDSGTVSLFFLPYCLTIVAGIWFYRLKGVGDVEVEEAGT